jgi:hypothetical protein
MIFKKQELDTLQKPTWLKLLLWRKKKQTLQTDLDKKVTETQPIIDGFDGLMARINALINYHGCPFFLSCSCFSH